MNTPIPYEAESERAVLGACMLSALAVEDAAAAVEPSDFFEYRHQAIFAAILAVHGSGRVVDPLTLHAAIEGTDVDLAYLHGLQNNTTYTTSNVAHYAERIAAANVRRRLTFATEQINRMVFEPGHLTATEIAQRSRDLLADIDMPLGRAAADPDMVTFVDQFNTPYDWLIPNFLERTDRCLITGGEGRGKSMLLAQIAVQVASGVHPWTWQEIEPRRSLIIDLENAPRLVGRRLAGLKTLAGNLLDPRNVRVHCRAGGLDLTTRTDRLWLIDRCMANETELLVIGPAYRMASGVAARGDVGQEDHIRTVTAALDDIRVRCGVSLLMETHAPHGDRLSRDLRPFGSSVWLRWPEFGVGLQQTDDPSYYELKHWRGPRDERLWPIALLRGRRWPWSPQLPAGMRDPQ